MQESQWQEIRNAMLPNGQDTSTIRNRSRSQDDAMVGYYFQRPQTDATQPYNNKRWALGDDTILEQGRNVSDLERELQSMSFVDMPRDHHMIRREMPPHAKKIWDDDKPNPTTNAVPPGKVIFANSGPWTRDESWSTAAATDPGLMTMIAQRRPGSDPASILSPRSTETGALGVNMAEYVLGGSPVGKEIDVRLHGVKRFGPGGDADNGGKVVLIDKGLKPQPYEVDLKNDPDTSGQPNGIIQNGLVDEEQVYRTTGSRQTSPIDVEIIGVPVSQAIIDQQQVIAVPANQGPQQISCEPQTVLPVLPTVLPPHVGSGFRLDAPHFEPVAIDPFQVGGDVTGVGVAPNVAGLMHSMDSPNFGIDYAQQGAQQHQQAMALLTQQQYALAAQQQQQQQQQQLGLVTQAFPAAAAATLPHPYLINTNSDPYITGVGSGQAVMPQYYSVQTPWGLYPVAGLVQTPQGAVPPQGQQTPQPGGVQPALMRSGGRPLTPSQGSQDQLGTPMSSMSTGQVAAATALQAQGGAAGTPYQILTPAYYDQNGQLVMGNGRSLAAPVRLVSPAPMLVNAAAAAAAAAAAQSNYTPTSNLYTAASNSLFTPITNTLGLTPQQAAVAATAGFPPPGTSATPGTIGTGLSSQRRDSLGAMLDYKRLQAPPTLAPLGQYYGTLGASSTSPAGPMGLVQPIQSLTPPASLSGSTGNLSLAGLGSGSRLYSAAPGAEAKYRNGSLSNTNGLFGTSLFNPRFMAKSANMSKEVSGRSRLLEDFRNSRIPNLQLKDLFNHVVEFSQDQHGSRFIQQKLERATTSEKSMVFNEILASAYSLMTDVFGNYVIQKFFEFGTPEQKQTLAQRVRGHVLPLALQMYGCRVIQKALESIPAEMQVEIVTELDGHVLKCVKDQNGNHVVQKAIECVDPERLQFIIDAFSSQVFALSTHPYGCRVIQRILEHCTPAQTSPVLDELHQHTERLVQDQYGNYVIQHVLEHGRADDRTTIVVELRGQVLALSQHKFASNVVEKCVSHSSRQERAMLIEEVCSMADGALYTMMKDQFANYVVQKMIDVAEPPQRKLLMHKIRPHVATLRKYTYGKHILAKLEKFYMKTSSEIGVIGMPPNSAGLQ